MPSIKLVGIYVYRGKAYLPVQARLESRAYMDIDPIFTAELDEEELVAAVEKVLRAGHPSRPDPTREEARNRRDPVLAATKARSWKALARIGAAYEICWTDTDVQVEMSRLDKKGRWEWDPEKSRMFPLDTPLSDIIAVVLEDIRSRPEVWE